MIRGITSGGEHIIGLVRGPLVDRLMRGDRVCLPGLVDANGMTYPHVCLVVRDSNRELIAAINEFHPDGFLPGAAVEHVSKEEPA
jgi:hypothetical protein